MLTFALVAARSIHHNNDVDVVRKEILSSDKTRKVQIFEREDGTYGFRTLLWASDPLEQCWTPCGRYSECFAPDESTAEREARSRVEWLRDLSGQS